MLGSMKTRLTLDADVAARFRRGLRRMSNPDDRPIHYRTPPVDLGRCRMGRLDDVAEALVVVEGERFR